LKLFERRRGRLHPVPEAHYLLQESQLIIDGLSRTERTMKSIRDLDRGAIRMVAMPGPSVFLLPDMISRFARGREDVRVSLITRSSEQVQRLVSVQQYDLGLADLGFPDMEKSPLVDHDIMTFRCVCALHRSDPLANRERITPEDLDGKPMAALFEDHPTHRNIEKAFAAAGARLNIRFESQYFIPMFTYIENGLACAIIDPLSVRSYAFYRGGESAIVFRPFFPEILLVASIMTPAHRPPSNLVKAFSKQIRAELEQISRDFSEGTAEAATATSD